MCILQQYLCGQETFLCELGWPCFSTIAQEQELLRSEEQCKQCEDVVMHSYHGITSNVPEHHPGVAEDIEKVVNSIDCIYYPPTGIFNSTLDEIMEKFFRLIKQQKNELNNFTNKYEVDSSIPRTFRGIQLSHDRLVKKYKCELTMLTHRQSRDSKKARKECDHALHELMCSMQERRSEWSY